MLLLIILKYYRLQDNKNIQTKLGCGLRMGIHYPLTSSAFMVNYSHQPFIGFIVVSAFISNQLMQHIDNLNYFFGFFNEKSEYTYINRAGLNWLGFKNLAEAEGKNHSMIHCEARQLASAWIAQDQETLKGSTTQFIGLNHYANDQWKLVHVEKTISMQEECKQILCIIRDLTCYPISFIPSIIKSNLESLIQGKPKQFSYGLVDALHPELTQRQSDCLFFLIQGYSGKEIARCLSLSHRTVEKHLDALKIKFNCDTKNQLIEKSMSMRFNEFIPKHFIRLIQ